jgi:activator of HSP90 ATPase
MKSILTKVTLAALLPVLLMACRPTENSNSEKANSSAQTARSISTPTVPSGSGKSNASENAGAAQGNSGEVSTEVKAELSTATRELLGIMLRGETKVASERLADDFKNTRPDGTVEDKAKYLANLKPFKDFDGFIYDEFKVESLQGDTAIVSGLVQAWGKDKKSFTGRFKETFVRRGGKWLLQSAQNEELKPAG